MVAQIFNVNTQEIDLYAFKASLVYTASPKIASTI